MNVSTSSATATASTSDVSSTQTQSKTSSSSKSDKSFEDEMKTASKTEETKNSSKDDKKISNDKKTEKDATKEANKLSQEMKEPDDIVPSDVYSGGVNFTDFKYHNEGQSLLSQNIQDLLNTKDLMNTVNSAKGNILLKEKYNGISDIFSAVTDNDLCLGLHHNKKYWQEDARRCASESWANYGYIKYRNDYDVINMSDSDANFFANLVQNTDMSMQSIAANISDQMAEGAQNIQKNVQVSSVLMDKLAESMKTNQPFRIDFDKDVSVIIKVNKDGSLAANFIPGDKAVEQYLRNNIASLRQRFDEQDLSYTQLSYSNSRQQQQQKRQNKEKQ